MMLNTSVANIFVENWSKSEYDGLTFMHLFHTRLESIPTLLCGLVAKNEANRSFKDAQTHRRHFCSSGVALGHGQLVASSRQIMLQGNIERSLPLQTSVEEFAITSKQMIDRREIRHFQFYLRIVLVCIRTWGLIMSLRSFRAIWGSTETPPFCIAGNPCVEVSKSQENRPLRTCIAIYSSVEVSSCGCPWVNVVYSCVEVSKGQENWPLRKRIAIYSSVEVSSCGCPWVNVVYLCVEVPKGQENWPLR